MFKGKAELVDPEKGNIVAVFNEVCHDDGVVVGTVRLRTPFSLQGTEFLGLFAAGTTTPMITVEASDPSGTEIREFHGKSMIGCILDGTGITLIKSPGGPLGTLLVVIGKGQVHQS